MSNVYFVVTDPEEQVWVITDASESEIAWLKVLANCIRGAKTLDKPVVTKTGVHFGMFSYVEFRNFMRATGFAELVVKADHRYEAAAV